MIYWRLKDTAGVTLAVNSMAHPILDTLAGFPLKVSSALGALDKAWADEGEEASRASQMNLILMFGAGVKPADAQARFDEAVLFAQRYPCRVIVLAARPASESHLPLEAKVNVVCFFDPNRRGKRCCEALMLAHGKPTNELESLVSTWLEGDLPVNVWAHGVTDQEMEPWLPWTRRCRRVVADRSITGNDFFSLPFPRPATVRDLSVARCLPARQAIGQFLAAHRPEVLVRGLNKVTLSHTPSMRGEAMGLLNWMRDCLVECSKVSGMKLKAEFQLSEDAPTGDNLDAEWFYDDGSHFSWEHADQGTAAGLRFTLGKETQTLAQRVAFMGPAEALSEAIFF